MIARRHAVLACVAVMTLTTLAWGRMIIMPTVARTCRGGGSWAKVTTCLARYGKPTVVAQRANARLVRLPDDATGGFRVPGLYLYTQQAGHWSISGAIEGEGYALGKLELGTYGGRRMYRIDVATANADPMVVDDQTRRALVRQSFSLFCPGTNENCLSVMTSCDVYVEGKIFWTFRGKLEFSAGIVRVKGDRSNVGGVCESNTELLLPTTTEIRELD